MFTPVLAIGSSLLTILAPIVFIGLLISKIFGIDLGQDLVWFGGISVLGVFTTPIFMLIGVFVISTIGKFFERLGL